MSSETLHGERSLPLSLFIVHVFVTQPRGGPPRKRSPTISLSVYLSLATVYAFVTLPREKLHTRRWFGTLLLTSLSLPPNLKQIMFKHRKYLGWWHWMHAYTLSKSNLTI